LSDTLSERSAGLYALLRIPSIYSGLQSVLGATRAQQRFVDEFVKPTENCTIIDFGAGTASIRTSLPLNCNYIAIEPNELYCQSIRDSYPDGSVEVVVGDVEALSQFNQSADTVLVVAVLHHLPDDEAKAVFAAAAQALRPGGRMVTLDNCYHTSQSIISRTLTRLDRGPFVRRPEEYVGLASSFFHEIQSTLVTDYLRVPYSHIILECRR